MKLQDFNEGYDPYYDLYLNNIETTDEMFSRLNENLNIVYNFFNQLSEDKMSFAYAPNKWTIAQILQHIIDTERIFCYRALKIVRENRAKIESYDHEAYAQNCKPQDKSKLLKDYVSNRKASISLFQTFDRTELKKSVDFGDYKFRVGLIPFIFCGHELHHLNVIRKLYL
ncbi:DinB family protein [Mesohalobacter halotolerans]|jgi:uncharacterized damage-inducible protein DinB|uniref:DinB family protein n=1 Tax=Mesohalobacter halotolerans TaxID=1883405 RepID=A0A4U5TQ42_9FLAO|nr:DinB family protein [Mesohalobacter halotolerans]NBC59020.1 DinB family protein [Bacteroidota bacterium]TKS56310.1 DinB family protein [Mesohalobacter halotolerans]